MALLFFAAFAVALAVRQHHCVAPEILRVTADEEGREHNACEHRADRQHD